MILNSDGGKACSNMVQNIQEIVQQCQQYFVIFMKIFSRDSSTMATTLIVTWFSPHDGAGINFFFANCLNVTC